MLKTETAKTRAENLKKAVREYLDEHKITEREAVREVAPLCGYSIRTAMCIVFGYAPYEVKKSKFWIDKSR